MSHPRLSQVFRQFAARPGLSLLLVGILALGMGVNAAMFGITDQVLFRPVPVSEPDTLVRIFTHEPDSGEISNGSYPWIESLARLEGPFAGVAAYSDWSSVGIAREGGGVATAVAGLASGAFFEVLGVRAALGRVFGSETDAGVGQYPVVVLGDRYWRARFNADPAALGRTLTIAHQPYTVIGVLPPGFDGPGLGGRVDVWLPMSMAPLAMAGQLPEDALSRRSFSWLDVVARLAPGTSVEAAQQAVDAWAVREAAQMPADQVGQGRGPHARLMPLRAAAVDPYGTEGQARKAWLLVAIAMTVLAIAAANAAGLLAVRGEERARELAVRVSLGAGPRTLLLQLLTETLALVAAGTLAGLVLGGLLAQALLGLQPGGMVLPEDAWSSVFSARVLLLTGGCATLALLLSGLSPALRALRLDVVRGLRAGGTHGTAGGERQRWRGALVAGQLALTLMLLVGAGLLLRSLWNTRAVDPGFEPVGVVAASVSLARPGLEGAARAQLFEAIRSRVASQPGVSAAGWMVAAPVQNGGMRTTAESDVPGTPKGADAQAEANVVSGPVFNALGVPVLQGRAIDGGDDGTRPVVVVNRAYVERFLPGVPPLGRRVVSLSADSGGAEIVGVVGDVRQRNLREPAPPQIYVPMAQMGLSRLTLVARVDGGAEREAALMGALPRLVAAVDPDAAVARVRTLDTQLADSMGEARVFAWLLIGFALLAAVLAASGLYGTVSYWLRGRTRELGIRIALGASRPRIAALVGRQGVRLLAIAVPVGALLAFAGSRALGSLMFGVGAFDPAAWAAAALLLLATAALATWLPLRRAMRLQPTEALRYE